MNIQRYTLPVIVAAGLHGALFLMTPESSVAHETKTKAAPLPPMPDTEKIVQIIESSETGETPKGGGPAIPVLVDVVVNLPEKTLFTTPQTETPTPKQLVAVDTRSITIPGDGTNKSMVEGIGAIPGIGSLDRHPRATAQMSPDYPLSLHQQGITGSVMVEFDVDTLGRVIRAEVVTCSRREFAEPALRAVRNWRFEPGKRNGKIVPFRMTIPIEFTIET